jgi:hypothetical protein
MRPTTAIDRSHQLLDMIRAPNCRYLKWPISRVSRSASLVIATRTGTRARMTSHHLLDDDLLARARELRAANRSPKEIARALGVRPSAVAPLMRVIAREGATEQPEPAVVGCWVSPNWSTGLTVQGHEDWPARNATDYAHGGLAGVVVARRYRPRRVSVCGYLVDPYCLGVKNALGPDVINDHELPGFVEAFFRAFKEAGEPVEASLELARHLVWGAVGYARHLGFSPHPDFQPASGHLGTWQETSDITFGRNGIPFFIQGPYDNPVAVTRTLTQSVGEGNFHSLATVGAVAGR